MSNSDSSQNLNWFSFETKARGLISNLVQPIAEQVRDDKEDFTDLVKTVSKLEEKLDAIMQLCHKTSK